MSGYFPLLQVCQFPLDELLSDSGYLIGEENSFDMVIFMLNDACSKSRIGLRMRLEVLIKVFYRDGRWTSDLLMDARDA